VNKLKLKMGSMNKMKLEHLKVKEEEIPSIHDETKSIIN